MHTFKRTACFLAIFPILSSLVYAQQTPEPAHQVLTGTPAAKPSALIFDAIVTDKSGKPISDLQQGNFTVLDNGQPAQILSFRPPAPAPAPGAVDAATEVIFIVDEVNADYNAVTYARDELKKFLLQNQGALAEPVCLGFLTDHGLNLQTQPTTDGNALADALEQQVRGFRIDQTGTGFYGAEDRLQRSINGFESLIAQESRTSFRKMVIWISPGWPLLSGAHSDINDTQREHTLKSVIALSNSLRQARIVLYSIDPLRNASSGEHSVFYQNFTKPLTKTSDAEFGDLGLQVLVTQTGGRAIFGNEMIQNSINHTLSDLRGIYTLAIAPASSDDPGKFHTLTVIVAIPELKVRTRNGYYLQP